MVVARQLAFMTQRFREALAAKEASCLLRALASSGGLRRVRAFVAVPPVDTDRESGQDHARA
jgi:hypothetical protein